VKKLLLAFVVLSACTRSTTTTTAPPPSPVVRAPSGNQLVGGATPKLAVEQFLAAVKAQDLQAMSVVFGTSSGPARDNMDRDQLDKRLVILQCFFNHDAARVYGEAPGKAGHRVFIAELTRGRQTRVPHFYTVQGPHGRWFVDDMEILAVRDFCSKS
jgi:hypothetical protein